MHLSYDQVVTVIQAFMLAAGLCRAHSGQWSEADEYAKRFDSMFASWVASFADVDLQAPRTGQVNIANRRRLNAVKDASELYQVIVTLRDTFERDGIQAPILNETAEILAWKLGRAAQRGN